MAWVYALWGMRGHRKDTVERLTEYEQGYEDGYRDAEKNAMGVFSLLVHRLGGRVEVSEKEAAGSNWRRLTWYFDPVREVNVYELKRKVPDAEG